mmetsp:Transcript_2847/g.6151  ORF Transcript_2847/g.6151 Transcript_2847/m.6151 type:complete len:235 (+) Transcript_2847:235-939(+)
MTQYKQTEGKKKDIPNFRILGCQLEAFLYLDEEMTDTENPSRRIPERKREPEIQDEFKTFQAKLLRSKLVPILEQPGLFPDIDDCSMPSASKFNLPQHGFIFKVDFSFAAARLLAALSAQSCRWASAVNSWGCSASSASYGAFRSGCELQVDPSQALCRVCPKDRFGGPLGRFFAVFESGATTVSSRSTAGSPFLRPRPPISWRLTPHTPIARSRPRARGWSIALQRACTRGGG